MATINNKGKTGNRFVKGKSGNPRGRPKGSKGKATQLRGLLESSKEKLIARVARSALKGNMAAMKLCIERIIPALKPVSEPVQIAISGSSLTEQAMSIFREAINGRLNGDDARQLMDLLSAQVKIEEFEQLKARIAELERLIEEKGRVEE